MKAGMVVDYEDGPSKGLYNRVPDTMSWNVKG